MLNILMFLSQTYAHCLGMPKGTSYELIMNLGVTEIIIPV
jgi:hypothetical protein